MNEKEIEKFDKDMLAFAFGFQQNVFQYIEVLRQKGYTLDDAKRYIPAKKKLLDKQLYRNAKEQKFIELTCPECSAIMFLHNVNTQPGDQTGDPKDKSVWMCQKNACLHTIYNEQTFIEIYKINKEKLSGIKNEQTFSDPAPLPQKEPVRKKKIAPKKDSTATGVPEKRINK